MLSCCKVHGKNNRHALCNILYFNIIDKKVHECTQNVKNMGGGTNDEIDKPMHCQGKQKVTWNKPENRFFTVPALAV